MGIGAVIHKPLYRFEGDALRSSTGEDFGAAPAGARSARDSLNRYLAGLMALGFQSSRLRPGSTLGLGLGCFLTSFFPLSLLPIRIVYRSAAISGEIARGKLRDCVLSCDDGDRFGIHGYAGWDAVRERQKVWGSGE